MKKREKQYDEMMRKLEEKVGAKSFTFHMNMITRSQKLPYPNKINQIRK